VPARLWRTPEAANAVLENADEASRQWLSRPDPDGCRSRLINILTGLGKTAAVVLAWLWNRVINPSLDSPRRCESRSRANAITR
jgi:hypothetical protein